MPIVLKYGSPGPVLAAGYAAGAGHRMNEQKDDALQVWQQNTQREFQAQQSWLDRYQQSNMQQNAFAQQEQQARAGRNFQALQAGAQREFQAGQADAGRTFQGGQTDKLIEARRTDSLNDQMAREADRQRHEQFLRDQNTEIGLRRGELALPPAAQAQLDKLEADSVEAMKLDPEKKAEFMGKYEGRKRELYGMAKPTNQVPYDDRLRNSLGSNYEKYKDLPWQFNEQGERSLPSGFKMPGDLEAQQQAASQKQITKYYDANRKVVDENGKPKFATPEDAMTAAMTEHQTVQGMLRGEKPSPAPESPPDPQNIASLKRSQQARAAGAAVWTTGGDLPPGRMRYGFTSEADAAKAVSAGQAVPPGEPLPQAASGNAPAEQTYEQGGRVYEQRNGKWVRVK